MYWLCKPRAPVLQVRGTLHVADTLYTLPIPQNHFLKHSTHFLSRYGTSSVLYTHLITPRTTSSSTLPTSSATKCDPGAQCTGDWCDC